MYMKFSTGAIESEARKHSEALVADVNRWLEDRVTAFPEEYLVNDAYPLVVILNGTASSGKDTLVQYVAKYTEDPVHHLSAVGPLRNIAKTLMESTEFFRNIEISRSDTVQQVIDNKTKAYRQLLSDLKHAWTKYNNGSNRYLEGAVIKLICEEGTRTTPEGELARASTSSYDRAASAIPKMIFVDCREPDNVKWLKKTFQHHGLLCVSMLIRGIEMEKGSASDADDMVNDMDYDIVIENSGTLESLAMTAFLLSHYLVRANAVHGFGIEGSLITLYDNIGEIRKELRMASEKRAVDSNNALTPYEREMLIYETDDKKEPGAILTNRQIATLLHAAMDPDDSQ